MIYTLYFVGNCTTNLAECWMHIRTKFDGGKQINRSQRGSWEGRCAGAGLRLNEGPKWGPKCWEKAVSVPANNIFVSHAAIVSKEVEKDRKQKSSLPAKQQRKKSHQTSTENTLCSQRSYYQYDGVPNATDVSLDIPPHHLQDLIVSFYKTKVVVTEQRAKQLELLTMQHGCDEAAYSIWRAERRLRITASIAGTIAKRRPSTQVGSTVHNMLYSKFTGNQATRWGLSQEKATAEEYIQCKQQQGSTGISVNTECGLIISTAYPWLAATPDGFVHDPQTSPSHGLVEFKNPYSCRDQHLLQAVQSKKLTYLSCFSGTLSLKKSDIYYYQIQVAMLCTSKKWCDFVVWTKVDLHVERIEFDELFCNSFLLKLRNFYFTSLLPELTSPHKPLREPKRVDNAEQWNSRINTLCNIQL